VPQIEERKQHQARLLHQLNNIQVPQNKPGQARNRVSWRAAGCVCAHCSCCCRCAMLRASWLLRAPPVTRQALALTAATSSVPDTAAVCRVIAVALLPLQYASPPPPRAAAAPAAAPPAPAAAPPPQQLPPPPQPVSQPPPQRSPPPPFMPPRPPAQKVLDRMPPVAQPAPSAPAPAFAQQVLAPVPQQQLMRPPAQQPAWPQRQQPGGAPQPPPQEEEPEPQPDDGAEAAPPGEPPLAGENVMNIVMVGAECAPWSKTGGLGDVMGALPKAFARRGHRIMVVAPRYENYPDAWETGLRRLFRVMNQDVEVGYFHAFVDGVDYVFVDHPCFHARAKDMYGGERAEIQFRYALLCKAALESVWHVPCGGVIYGDNNTVFVANDWHTALLPVYLQVRRAFLGGGGGGGGVVFGGPWCLGPVAGSCRRCRAAAAQLRAATPGPLRALCRPCAPNNPPAPPPRPRPTPGALPRLRADDVRALRVCHPQHGAPRPRPLHRVRAAGAARALLRGLPAVRPHRRRAHEHHEGGAAVCAPHRGRVRCACAWGG
jgi:hypothetical protein